MMSRADLCFISFSLSCMLFQILPFTVVRPAHNPNQRGVAFFPPDDAINPLHPMFLHPSDNSEVVLVIKLLNGANYINWSRSMKIVVLAKNKLDFIDGYVTKPLNVANPFTALWERLSLGSSTLPPLKFVKASQIWTYLHGQFLQR